MEKLVKILLILFFVCPLPGVSQPKRICVMGSSSAYGYFPNTTIPRDSAWAFKVKEYFKGTGEIDTLYNIGTPGIDCYIGMPTGYVPPAGRNLPNPDFNITKAVNFVPAPDVIIINFPSNNYTVLSIAEIMFCLQTMKDYANARNIRCYITTTQPRNDFVQLVERQKLREIKDSIEERFGVFSIDFWTDIVQEPSLFIRPEYNLGDGVHLTPEGHTVLKNKVIARDIFFAPVALDAGMLYATDHNDHVLVSWKPGTSTSFTPYRLERADGTGSFNTIYEFPSGTSGEQMLFSDENAFRGINLYRVAGSYAGGGTIYSSVISVKFDGTRAAGPYLFPTVSSTFINLILPPGFSTSAVICDAAGKVVWRKKYSEANFRRNERIDVTRFASGMYRLYFPGSNFKSIGLIR